MILNTESKTSYNNFLRNASLSMHLGLNSDVNNQTKVTGIRHNLGASKVSFVNQNNQRTTTKEKTPVTPIVSVLRTKATNKPEIAKPDKTRKKSSCHNDISRCVDIFLIQNMSRFTTRWRL